MRIFRSTQAEVRADRFFSSGIFEGIDLEDLGTAPPKPEKDATPATATAVTTPVMLPLPALFDKVIVLFASVVAVLPPASKILTIGWISHVLPVRQPDGALVIHTSVAGP